MSLVLPLDVANALNATISEVSQPNTDDVQAFINQIEGEVQALWIAAGGVWPAAVLLAPQSLFLTVLLGSEWLTLQSKFSGASAAMTPDVVPQTRQAYEARLNRIPSYVLGSEATDVPAGVLISTGPSPLPLLLGDSFAAWTEVRDAQVRFLHPYRPWRRYQW